MAQEAGIQQEVTEAPATAFEMEKRLLATKNVYAENSAQKRDTQHSYSSYTLAFSLADQKKIVVSAEERYHMIAKEAYYRAKRQGFKGQSFAQDWLAAEAEIDAMLKGNEQEPSAPRPDRTLRGHE
jgi:hypothetical protein